MQEKEALQHLFTLCWQSLCFFVSMGWHTLYDRSNGDLKVGRGTHLDICKNENDHNGHQNLLA